MKQDKSAARRKHLDGDVRKVAIIETAIQLLASHGMEGLRTRNVAKAVGISHPTLHYHFPTKSTLVDAMVERIVHRFEDSAVLQASDGSGPRERLVSHLNTIEAEMRASPEIFVALIELLVASRRDPEIAAIVSISQERWKENVCSMIGEGFPAGDVEMAAEAIIDMVRGLSIGPEDQQPDVLHDRFSWFVEMVVGKLEANRNR